MVQPAFTEVQTKVSDFFRRFAEVLDDPQRREILNTHMEDNAADLMEIMSSIKKFAWERCGGVILIGDDWKEKSYTPSQQAEYKTMEIKDG